MDGAQLGPLVEDSCSFGHFLELSPLLQVSRLGNDRDGLRTTGEREQEERYDNDNNDKEDKL